MTHHQPHEDESQPVLLPVELLTDDKQDNDHRQEQQHDATPGHHNERDAVLLNANAKT